MTMVDADTRPLTQAADSLEESAAVAIHKASTEAFEAFERQLSDFEALCRETQQSLWAEETRNVIRRLEHGEPLAPADQQVLRAFLISDAEHYLAVENNCQDWIKELQRLVNEIVHRSGQVDRESLACLRGVVKDAVRLVPNIRNYFEEKHRIERCKLALGRMDDESRILLARILKEALHDPRK